MGPGARTTLKKRRGERPRKAAKAGGDPSLGNPLPLEAGKIEAIAALMKLDGFRSFANYASAAKRVHVLRGFEWTQLLAMTVAECARSATRGRGPAPRGPPGAHSERGDLPPGDYFSPPAIKAAAMRPRGPTVLRFSRSSHSPLRPTTGGDDKR